ncbi:TIGR02300 family protein [Xaviernesmea oryzae]|uniref:TIGR02300 family protein n=1 Tax=Xaviernesmea oryzae TaxID=464029 RepID=A0A1X7EQ91_9HYPH|nr:TIGR02300 family protein [Xaviernesmea oryzae]
MGTGLDFSPDKAAIKRHADLFGHPHEALTVAKAELGTKRTDPDTGKKFYDLNRDPVVSPYTGKSWPLSFFEENSAAVKMEQAEEEDVQEVDTENQEVELVSLEEGDEASGSDDLPDMGDDDVDLGDDDDDTFLEADEDDEDDDMSGIIGVTGDDDEV